MPPLKEVTIYTDGACLGNPGPGGYAAVLLYGGRRKELSGGFRLTTNNRMELTAAIQGLAALKQPCRVRLFTDSQYLANSLNQGWARRWRARNWHRNKKDKAENPDLWERLIDLIDKHRVEVIWIRGHDGNPENERCDALAVNAARQPGLPPDPAYEDARSLNSSGK
jgi:ribonuclease HI